MKYTNANNNFYAKVLYAIVLLVFVFVSFSLIMTINGQEKTWLDFADTSYTSEIITDENGQQTFINYVSTPEQLAGIFVEKTSGVYASNYQDTLTNVSSKYVLTQDIDCSDYNWTGVNLDSGITIDGNHYTIIGLKFTTSQEVQGFVKTNNGTIQNLYFKLISFTSGNTSISTFGIVAGENKGTIKNCKVIGDSVISHAKEGIVGGIAGTNSNGTIANCINYANITVLEWGGGIVGRQYSGTVHNCFNYGKISSLSSTTFARIGGVVGELSEWGTLKNCYNEGIVLGACADGATVYAGGIVGLCEANVSCCANKGNILGGYANCEVSYTGGIVGGDYSKSITISDCYNTGAITAQAKQTTITPTYTHTDISEKLIHHHLYWHWVVSCKDEMYYARSSSATQIEKKAYAGGIAGKCSNKIQNCYNIGDVVGGSKYSRYKISESYKTRYYCNAIQNVNSPATYSTSYTIEMYDAIYSAPICPNVASATNCFYSSEVKHDYNMQNNFSYNSGKARVPSSRSGGWLIMNNVSSDSSLNFTYDISNKMVGYWDTTKSWPYVRQNFYISEGYLIYKATPYDCSNHSDNVNTIKNSFGLKIKLNPNSPIKGTSKINDDIKTLTLNDNWSVSPNINDEYPYLKDLYWE